MASRHSRPRPSLVASMTTRRVAWRRSDEVEVDEHCPLTVRDSGLSLVGTVIGGEAGLAHRVEYRVLADREGLTTAGPGRGPRAFRTGTLSLQRDAKNRWTVDGAPVRALTGCTDVELGFSPSTNTL